jgi:hypothetical protein
VDLMNTTGFWQTERPRDPIHVHPHSQSVVTLMGPASFSSPPQSRTTSWTMIVITC